MASITEICNRALGRIGDAFISSLEDNSRQARVCNRFYDITRRQLLTLADWGFAGKRMADMSPLTTSPLFGYDYQFQLPSDCLKVRGLYSPRSHYVLEGSGRLLSNDETIDLLYTYNVDDPNNFTDMFVSTLELRLAYTMSYAIAPSAELTKTLYNLYGVEYAEARRTDCSAKDYSVVRPVELEFGKNRTWVQARNR